MECVPWFVVRSVTTGEPGPHASVPTPARVRTFHPRRGRLSGRHHDALRRLWPVLGVPVALPPAAAAGLPDSGPGRPAAGPGLADRGVPGARPAGAGAGPQAAEAPGRPVPLDPVALFGRSAPLVLEIGSGMGDATVEMAAADPGRDYLAVEIHTPGIAHLLALVERRGLANVRVAAGDALDLLRHQIAPDQLTAVHAYFPDPWPKARHHKRRLIQPAHVALIRSRLAPGGLLHCATDWPAYAEAMLATLTADGQLRNLYDGYAPRPAARPLTKFELRALAAGRPVRDLMFVRDVPAAP